MFSVMFGGIRCVLQRCYSLCMSFRSQVCECSKTRMYDVATSHCTTNFCMLSQHCALQNHVHHIMRRAVMPWPTITGNKCPNLALLWQHKQGTKTFILLQMDCLKIIFLATICISVENVHIENWHLLWNALRSISNPKIIRNSFVLLGAALCNRRHKYKIGEYWRTSWPLLLEVGLQDDFRLASKIFK